MASIIPIERRAYHLTKKKRSMAIYSTSGENIVHFATMYGLVLRIIDTLESIMTDNRKNQQIKFELKGGTTY